jgi:hypothetical protein
MGLRGGGIFWRARDTVTGQEVRNVTRNIPLWDRDQMAAWVRQFWRNLELIDHREWDDAEDGRRLVYPVPVQYVQFKPDHADKVLTGANDTKRSVLITTGDRITRHRLLG